MRNRLTDYRLALVMVGLPARGKTHIARRIARYLNWKGVSARVFNVGSYRRELVGAQQPHSFFDPGNPEGMAARERMARAALDDLIAWLDADGSVAIFDATNTTRARRERVENALHARGIEVVFVESVCDDPAIIEANVVRTKVRSPDYTDVDPEQAVADFRRRIAHYEAVNEPLDDTCRYLRVVDVGRKIVANRIHDLPSGLGWLLGGVLNLLSCLHTDPRTIYLTRHGQSAYNAVGRIGGDVGLTQLGERYAARLGQHLAQTIDQGTPEVWTSTLARTRHTAEPMPWTTYPLKSLDEIDAGACDGMTYAEIRDQMPSEYAARKHDKLNYRYPQGESYVDVIHRLEPVILEMERQRGPLVVVGHQAVLRVLYGYFTDRPAVEIPFLKIPLHTVIALTPIAYGALEERTKLL